MKKLFTIMIAIMVISSDLCVLSAQEIKPTEEQTQLASALLVSAFKAIKEKAPEKYRKDLRSISYELIPSLDPEIFHVDKTDTTKNSFKISVGAVNLVMNLHSASAASIFIENGSEKMVPWLQAVAKSIESKNYEYASFFNYTKSALPENDMFQPMLREEVYAGISFIIAHECAHILLGHTDAALKNLSIDQMRSLEYEADRLSVELIVPLADGNETSYTFYSSGYLQLFLYSMSRNLDVMGFESMRGHPPELKRAELLAGAFYQKAFQISSNEKFIKSIEKNYNYRIQELKFYNQIIQYRSYVNDPKNEVISLKEWQKLSTGK